MNNDEFQQLVLAQLVELANGQREIQQSVARMEQDHGSKLTALFDAREVQQDVNERICDSLNRIESKMDRLTLKYLLPMQP